MTFQFQTNICLCRKFNFDKTIFIKSNGAISVFANMFDGNKKWIMNMILKMAFLSQWIDTISEQKCIQLSGNSKSNRFCELSVAHGFSFIFAMFIHLFSLNAFTFQCNAMKYLHLGVVKQVGKMFSIFLYSGLWFTNMYIGTNVFEWFLAWHRIFTAIENAWAKSVPFANNFTCK